MTEIRGQKSEISKATALGAMVFALCSLLFAPCSAADAQQLRKPFRIGFLDSAQQERKSGDDLTQGLQIFFDLREGAAVLLIGKRELELGFLLFFRFF
jgi:hypothetical protein